VQATIESAQRSQGGYKETVRLDVVYSYAFSGQWYSGRMVRDTCFSIGAVNAAIDQYARGRVATVRVNPRNPRQSYLPSGLGWFEPLLMSFVSVGSLVLVVGILLSEILSAISQTNG